MLLTRSESTVLSNDPYQNELSGQGQVNNVSDPFSYSCGYGQVVPLAANATGVSVALPFVTAGSFLRIECASPVSFSLDGGISYLTTTVPSASSGGSPITGVCMMFVSYTSLLFTNPSSTTLYVQLIVAGN